ncbi:MAG: aminotransferase class I/II-fold pyridoxal phosphate-dependent enzyme [Lachnospiraceae bacterium]|nr:aminotransferase class I/II-fold pyridoxal phosphate-dependent enzyme [Lachnospiraceae bacterium]
MDKINETLNQIESGDLYPFHMPGHKRQMTQTIWKSVYSRDITEIDGCDNLHHAEGIIKEEQQYAAQLFGAEESYYLVNGSSCGVLAAICTVTEQQPMTKVLMCRNAHKSAYNGLMLSGAWADYLYPQKLKEHPYMGTICVDDVKEALKKEFYAAVFITSPTYEGIVSDIRKICELSHDKGIPVIVDEAHGAHLGIWGDGDFFPESALSQGADIVIQSLHKTLPAMTQTAIIHVQGDRIDRQKLRLFLSTFQSSSPSYIMMNSISSCLHFCDENRETLIQAYKKRLKSFYKKTETLQTIRIYGLNKEICKDPGKIIIDGTKCGLSGSALSKVLRERYHLEMEMAAKDYCIAMTSVMDTEEGFERLWKALEELDTCEGKDSGFSKKCTKMTASVPKTKSAMTIKTAISKEKEKLLLEGCKDRISCEFIYPYPPGIPIVAPGEIITTEILDYIKAAKNMEVQIQGPEDYSGERICCIKEVDK